MGGGREQRRRRRTWALGAHWLESLRVTTPMAATVVAELTIVLQVILGVALITIDDYEVAQFHMFYGFVALATIGMVYSYRHQLREHLYVLYGLGGLFLMGLALRHRDLPGALTLAPEGAASLSRPRPSASSASKLRFGVETRLEVDDGARERARDAVDHLDPAHDHLPQLVDRGGFRPCDTS